MIVHAPAASVMHELAPFLPPHVPLTVTPATGRFELFRTRTVTFGVQRGPSGVAQPSRSPTCIAAVAGGVDVGGTGVLVRVAVDVGATGVLVRVGVDVAATGVLVRVAVRVGVDVAATGVLVPVGVRVGVDVAATGVLVRVGVRVGVAVGPDGKGSFTLVKSVVQYQPHGLPGTYARPMPTPV